MNKQAMPWDKVKGPKINMSSDRNGYKLYCMNIVDLKV